MLCDGKIAVIIALLDIIFVLDALIVVCIYNGRIKIEFAETRREGYSNQISIAPR